MAIGVVGVLELLAIPLAGRVYLAQVGYGLPGFLLRGLVCGICVLPPTVLLGATLPIVARWPGSTPKGISGTGLLYSANTAGAVCGCLLAGFYLLRVHDVIVATLVAAALDGVVAASAWFLSIREPHGEPSSDSRGLAKARHYVPGHDVRRPGTVYLAIGLSGCCALGAEVIWTRLLSLLLGGTVYTFSIILAVFLFGLGLGSFAAAWLSPRAGRARLMLGGCQLLLTAAIAWAAYVVGVVLPFRQIELGPSSSPWLLFGRELLHCLLAILPAASLWGASFPLALVATAVSQDDPARPVAKIYAANTLEAIVGTVVTSLWLIPSIGNSGQQILVACSWQRASR